MRQETVRMSVPSVQEVMGKEAVKHLPEKKFRSGAVAATIWLNEKEIDGKKASFRTVSFERSYLDKNKAWQNTNSLRTGDLPKAVLVLSKAYEYLALNNDNEAIDEEAF